MGTQKNCTSINFLLFQKRSKSVSSAWEKVFVDPNSKLIHDANSPRSGATGSGAGPRKTSYKLLFQKRSKSVSSAWEKVLVDPNSKLIHDANLGHGTQNRTCGQQ
jgi:hypothetical protein